MREEQGIASLRITPEAGTVKMKARRYVPLHPHLIEQGFLDFARARGSGPLFYDARAGRHLGEWVRELGVRDPDVQPNHGWRHLFKTLRPGGGDQGGPAGRDPGS